MLSESEMLAYNEACAAEREREQKREAEAAERRAATIAGLHDQRGDVAAELEQVREHHLEGLSATAHAIDTIVDRIEQQDARIAAIERNMETSFSKMLADAVRNITPPVVRGTFDAKTSYRASDIVALNGGSFIAKHDSPGVCPGEGWQMIAKQGPRGMAGQKGDKGEKGERGLPGADAPRPISWQVDRGAYTAVMIYDDGSRGPTLDLRELFAQFQDETQ
jgi:hypothetical protein